jgi:hypothetical protein
MNATERTLGRPIIGSIGFYIVFVVLAIVLVGVTNYFNSIPFFAPGGEPDPAALSKSWDAFAGIINLLTTLATGLLAGMGWFFTNRLNQRYPARDLWLVGAGATCAILSIYFGYISSQNLLWAIENSVGVFVAKVQRPRQMQFVALVLGVVFFADFVRRNWNKVD